jgi:hypothetical protein
MPKKTQGTRIETNASASDFQHTTHQHDAVQFLLAEFNETAEDWRHTDTRIETAINFYLTIVAIVLPSLIVLYQTIQNPTVFVLAAIPINGFLFIVGFFLTRRITSASILKSQYRSASQLIRRYFVDLAPELTTYIQFPVARPLGSTEKQSIPIRTALYHRVILAVNAANSVLAGASAAGLTWLLAGTLFSAVEIVGIGLATTVLSFFFLHWLFIRRIAHVSLSAYP